MREREHSGFWLGLRLMAFGFLNNMIMSNLFPFHEFYYLIGFPHTVEEKYVRYEQFVYFQKHRDPKYDCLELGVLEKFPYPVKVFDK